MATYRYLFCDLRTNAVLAELPLSDVQFDLKLNGAGSLRAKLSITDRAVTRLDPLGSTQPGRTAVYVDRDGVLLWGGVLWTRSYSSDGSALELGANEFLSYFERRLITSDAVFDQVDQLAIARSLIGTAQAVAGGDIGVALRPGTSGVLRDRTYYGSELKSVGEALSQLASVSGGFDYAIDVAYVAGTPTRTLALGYPRRGQVAARSGWLWEYPGNVQAYSWPEDATQQANRSWALGAGTGPGVLVAAASATSLIDAGYPLLEDATSYSDVTEPATLQAHAVADLAALADPVTIPTLAVRADADPVLGSYVVGDELRLRVTDARWPATIAGQGAGLDRAYRLVAVAVRPPGSGSSEAVTLTLGATV